MRVDWRIFNQKFCNQNGTRIG